MLRKGWEALGAFDPDERRRALDLLGFSSQLVFTTFAITHFWVEVHQVRATPEVLYGGTRAHNRAIADFCRGDKRLLGVGFVPLDIPELAEKEIDEAIKLGCAAIHIPSLPPAKKSPKLNRTSTACGRGCRMPTFRSCCISGAAAARSRARFTTTIGR